MQECTQAGSLGGSGKAQQDIIAMEDDEFSDEEPSGTVSLACLYKNSCQYSENLKKKNQFYILNNILCSLQPIIFVGGTGQYQKKEKGNLLE